VREIIEIYQVVGQLKIIFPDKEKGFESSIESVVTREAPLSEEPQKMCCLSK
jgi:hypothetical protein